MADERTKTPYNQKSPVPEKYSWPALLPLEESDNLPDPDVIAQEIIEDLEAVLEQFREIVTDLSNGESSDAG